MGWTIGGAIGETVAGVPGGRLSRTVDVVKAGDVSRPLKGIVTTWLATRAVIGQAVEHGANLIITHEPVFYSHLDQTDWLAGNPVYEEKRALIEENGLVVWRFHDYLHRLRPDPTLVGLLEDLGWEGRVVAGASATDGRITGVCEVPQVTLGELAALIKARLGLTGMQVVGDLDQPCRRVGISVGAPGGRVQIDVLWKDAVDVLVAGEINEWETAEYARDATSQGRRQALILIGHEASEAPGMRRVVPWFEARLPGVPVTHLRAGSPFVGS
jgi:putative NIF3 family GTP cyclohydrolase 1 type 2